MAYGGTTVEHLQQFLRDLTPAERARLIGCLERSLLQGGSVPGGEMVLRELRRVIAAGERPARLGNPSRLFFASLEPFLVDDVQTQAHPGRIARAALSPIWRWISEDLMPAEAKAYSDAANAALLAHDQSAAQTCARDFQILFASRLRAALAALPDDERARWRWFAKISTPRAAEDMEVLLQVYGAHDRLQQLATRLPEHIEHLSDSTLHSVRAAVDTAVKGRPGLFPFALLVVMSRLSVPWQIVRLAVDAARSDAAARVAETPYAVAVDITLCEMERLTRALRDELRGGRAVSVTALLKEMHDTARGLRTELALPVESAWGKQYGAARSQIADLLKSELESAPGVVRRLLRAKPRVEKGKPGRAIATALDAEEVMHVEGLVDMVIACRAFAGELAVNELSMRTFLDLRHYLDATVRGLQEAARHVEGEERAQLRAQLTLAARLYDKVSRHDPSARAAAERRAS